MLKGKTAFITGANRGIGKAIFDKFIKNGADIICAVRKKKPLFLKKSKIKYLYFQSALNSKFQAVRFDFMV